MTDQALVLGLDVGGTATRALAATLDGTRRGSGRAAGGNPTGLGPRRAAAALAEAVRQALAGLDPAALRHVVVGLAGGGALADGEDLPGREEFARVWEQAGLECPVAYEGDALIAFVAGTDEAEGSLLLSGTGACAIAVKDRTLAARSDGHGWLLGDRGSGFWLGRQAVLAAMAELDGEGPQTPLTPLVIESLLHRADGDQQAATPPQAPHRPVIARDLVTGVMAGPPLSLPRLAPLVFTACAAADPVAESIVEHAAAHLIATLSAVREPRSATPIVLAGSILTHPTPVAARVRAVLRERWPEAAVDLGLDGAAAAVWLALNRLRPPPGGAVRERLFSGLHQPTESETLPSDSSKLRTT